MAFENFQVNNNEAAGDFTLVARIDFPQINELITGGVAVQIGVIPKGGGVEMSGVSTSPAIVSVIDNAFVSVGTTLIGPEEFNLTTQLVSGVELADYNSGTLMAQAAGTTTVIAGSLPVSIAVSAETPVYVSFTGDADLTAGEVVRLINVASG